MLALTWRAIRNA